MSTNHDVIHRAIDRHLELLKKHPCTAANNLLQGYLLGVQDSTHYSDRATHELLSRARQRATDILRDAASQNHATRTQLRQQQGENHAFA